MGYTKIVINIYSSLSPSTSRSNKSSMYDTGASGHCLQDYAPHDIALRPTLPIKVNKPNGQLLQSTKVCRMTLATLPDEEI